jgi:hypothetical protein
MVILETVRMAGRRSRKVALTISKCSYEFALEDPLLFLLNHQHMLVILLLVGGSLHKDVDIGYITADALEELEFFSP